MHSGNYMQMGQDVDHVYSQNEVFSRVVPHYHSNPSALMMKKPLTKTEENGMGELELDFTVNENNPKYDNAGFEKPLPVYGNSRPFNNEHVQHANLNMDMHALENITQKYVKKIEKHNKKMKIYIPFVIFLGLIVFMMVTNKRE